MYNNNNSLAVTNQIAPRQIQFLIGEQVNELPFILGERNWPK